MDKRAAIYVRVSTDKKSVENQLSRATADRAAERMGSRPRALGLVQADIFCSQLIGTRYVATERGTGNRLPVAAFSLDRTMMCSAEHAA